MIKLKRDYSVWVTSDGKEWNNPKLARFHEMGLKIKKLMKR